MGERSAALLRVLVAVLIVAGALTFTPNAVGASPRANNCGRLDKPETGLQGEVPLADQLSGRAFQGYNCGLSLVGHVNITGGSGNMAWYDHCAYVASVGTGVTVVDVSEPRHPRVTRTLHGPGSQLSLETIAAHRVGDRGVLVAGRYGYAAFAPVEAPMDIWDVTDCAHPKFVRTYNWPTNIHNLTFSPDGYRLYSSLPIQVIDLHDLRRPKYLGLLETQIRQRTSTFRKVGLPVSDLAHEVYTSPDGNTLYLGGQTPTFGLNTFTIVDVTDWPKRRPRILSQVRGRGHSMRLANIDGRTYALHSEESIVGPAANGCISKELNPVAGAAQPWLSDVTDPRHPKLGVSQLRLAINDPKHCAKELADLENANVHYHDVDNEADTTFVMASMFNAGLRIFDVRDPVHPKEAAYFNPGAIIPAGDSVTLDKAWAHVRYVPETGLIWLSTQTGGFWVLELEPQVRQALGLASLPSINPNGSAPRPAGGIGIVPTSSASASPAEYYCTLGAIVP